MTDFHIPKEQFAGMIWIDANNPDDINIALQEYDYSEIYNPDKVYHRDCFREIFKGTAYYYRNFLLTTDIGSYYVVRKRQKNPHWELEIYCNCLRCKYCLYFLCPVYTQCLKLGPGYYSCENFQQAQYKKDHPISYYNVTCQYASITCKYIKKLLVSLVSVKDIHKLKL